MSFFMAYRNIATDIVAAINFDNTPARHHWFVVVVMVQKHDFTVWLRFNRWHTHTHKFSEIDCSHRVFCIQITNHAYQALFFGWSFQTISINIILNEWLDICFRYRFRPLKYFKNKPIPSAITTKQTCVLDVLFTLHLNTNECWLNMYALKSASALKHTMPQVFRLIEPIHFHWMF